MTHPDLFHALYPEGINRIPIPSYRHATPSAPWPWIDIGDGKHPIVRKLLVSDLPLVSSLCDRHEGHEECWRKYPESRFPNWAEGQIKKSKILKVIKEYDRDQTCRLYYIDVSDNGKFTSPTETVVTEERIGESWKFFLDHFEYPQTLLVRALFVENLSGPVLQMLGTKFNIEPFFWASSLNWIPSYYQEDLCPGLGDHITICLAFPRSIPKNTSGFRMDAASRDSSNFTVPVGPSTFDQLAIDTQAPLPLSTSDQLLVSDLLSVHLIRHIGGSTIISYHPSLSLATTTAEHLHQRIQLAGQSTHWKTVFQKSADPTFLLLVFLWHAAYAWDEALENLCVHICTLETRVLDTGETSLTSELHILRAHLQHYYSLLEDFRETVQFIMETPNPASEGMRKHERELTEIMLRRECQVLLKGIRKVESRGKMVDKRLENIMNLVFNSISISDSRRMQMMTEAAIRNSGGVVQANLHQKHSRAFPIMSIQL